MARFSTAVTWLLFGISLSALLAGVSGEPLTAGPIRVDALALVLAVAVTLISGVVHLFARRHLTGEPYYTGFFVRLGALTLAVLLLLVADHLALLALAWMATGLLLAGLLGQVSTWPQAQAAAGYARRRFLFGGGVLALGLGVLGHASGSATLSGALAAAPTLDPALLATVIAALTLAAMIQSGLWPFQRWLLSSLNAPTPVSAFMHAGVVNAGGILLARCAPLFEPLPAALAMLFLIGALAALWGSLAALVQTDVKRALAASTSAQMGFMVLQCGLGHFAAALAHLMLHGGYKACQFLGAGSALAGPPAPQAAHAPPGPGAAATALLAAITAGAAFALVSGKLAGGLDSGAVLVVFAGLAAAQAVLGLSPTRTRLPPVLLGVALAGALHGALVLNIERLLAPMPTLVMPQALTPLMIAVTLTFIGAWLVLLFGLHRRSARLYARVLAASQPVSATVTDRRETYHA